MTSPDMEVIKEVPGYRVILKAVLKSQIQQLIEQLAAATNEESIILTASVADGTLSHLGSDSAKGFLQDHEDVKSQFLGYCLKTHHERKQEEDRRAAEEAEHSLQQQLQQVTSTKFSPAVPWGGVRARSPKFMSPKQQGAVHPVTLSRAGPGVRHEPYSIQSPRRQMVSPSSEPGAPQAKKVKSEPEDTESAGKNSSHNVANEDENSKSSVGQTVKNHDRLGLGAEFSNFMSGDKTVHCNNYQSDFGDVDSNVKVKLEHTTDADMDELEITGVEPGHVMALPPDSWDPNVSMTTDPTGASGSQEDMASQQGYNTVNDVEQAYAYTKAEIFACEICGKIFAQKTALTRHRRGRHSEEGIVMCSVCGKEFQTRDDCHQHKINVHNSTTAEVVCQQCGKSLKSKHALYNHRIYAHKKKYVCAICGHRFGKKSDLDRHTKSHRGEKDQCPYCGEQFMDLKRHSKYCNTANADTSNLFSCDLCEKTFLRKQYLTAHKFSMHEPRTYKCQHCPKDFKHRSSRIRHLEKVHPKL